MNDSPAASIARRFDSYTIPASATTVTSVRWWAAMKAAMAGSMVVVSARFPSNAVTDRGTGEQTDRDLRFQPSFLREPRSRNPSPVSVSK